MSPFLENIMEAFHLKPQTPVESPLRTDKRIRKNCRTKERTVQGLYATAAAEELYSQSCKKNGLYQHHLQQNQGHYQKYHHRGQQPHHPQPQQQQQHLSHDHWTCIMMTMLFVISIVLTGNSGKPASQQVTGTFSLFSSPFPYPHIYMWPPPWPCMFFVLPPVFAFQRPRRRSFIQSVTRPTYFPEFPGWCQFKLTSKP